MARGSGLPQKPGEGTKLTMGRQTGPTLGTPSRKEEQSRGAEARGPIYRLQLNRRSKELLPVPRKFLSTADRNTMRLPRRSDLHPPGWGPGYPPAACRFRTGRPPIACAPPAKVGCILGKSRLLDRVLRVAWRMRIKETSAAGRLRIVHPTLAGGDRVAWAISNRRLVVQRPSCQRTVERSAPPNLLQAEGQPVLTWT